MVNIYASFSLPFMMFYHDGLRITLPKMPATAQNFGHPPLIIPLPPDVLFGS